MAYFIILLFVSGLLVFSSELINSALSKFSFLMLWFNLTTQIQVVWFKFGFWWAIFQPFNLLLYLVFVFSCLLTFLQKIYSECLFISACSAVFKTPDDPSFLQKSRFLFIFIPSFPHALLIYALISSSFRQITVLSPWQHLFVFEQEYLQPLLSFHIFSQGTISGWCLIAVFFKKFC